MGPAPLLHFSLVCILMNDTWQENDPTVKNKSNSFSSFLSSIYPPLFSATSWTVWEEPNSFKKSSPLLATSPPEHEKSLSYHKVCTNTYPKNNHNKTESIVQFKVTNAINENFHTLWEREREREREREKMKKCLVTTLQIPKAHYFQFEYI